MAAVALAVLAIAIVQLKTRNTALAKDAQLTFQSPAEAGAAAGQGSRKRR